MQEKIQESFKYYDNSLKKYKKYYKNNNKLKLFIDFIDDVPIFELKNDDKVFMKGDYNFIGIFGKKEKENINYFRWGWDMLYITSTIDKKDTITYFIKNEDVGINKVIPTNINNDMLNINNTYYIKKIINYIFDLKININNSKETFFYKDMKNIFLHYMIEIQSPIFMELILAMTLHITKSDLIWKVDDEKNNHTRYYLLRNVQEL
jgi:hypothetical protein